jgi:hypothetical protein
MSSVWDLETVPDLRGFAAADGLDGKFEQRNPPPQSATNFQSQSGRRDMVTGNDLVLPLPFELLYDQQRRENIIPCHDIFYRLGVDDGFETAVAVLAAPNMMDLPLIPKL